MDYDMDNGGGDMDNGGVDMDNDGRRSKNVSTLVRQFFFRYP